MPDSGKTRAVRRGVERDADLVLPTFLPVRKSSCGA